MIGKTLGKRYTILEEVNGGGMAVVYKARCTLLNRIVAIKVLKPEFADDEDFVRRFRREAQAAASLSHPNIVGIYDVGDENGLYYIVMEYVEGATLKELIKQKTPIPIKETIDIGMQICDALECAHKNKIVHRDIKSQNIMITPDGRVKVTDFGIARATGGATITNTGNVFGSVQYFSPEQARSDVVDERSDLYSVGVVLYEAFTGELPFNGQTPVAIALKQIQEKPEPISSLIHGFPEQLEAIVEKCMAKSPNDRYQTARELRNDLAAVSKDPFVVNFKPVDVEQTLVLDDIQSSSADSSSHITRKKPRNILKGIAIAAALVVLFGIFSYIGGNLAKRYLEVPEVLVPNLIGWSEEDAIAELKKLNLSYNIADRVYDKAPAGQVIDQDPKGDQLVKVNHPGINLVISKGAKSNPVPKIIGETEQDGVVLLQNSGFEVGRVKREYFNDVPEGVIVDQNPREGITLTAGEYIDFTVSLGPEIADVPNVIGKTIDEAKALLQQKNISNIKVSKKPSDYPENTVIEQSPGPNEAIEPNGTVSLVVSEGSVQSKTISVQILLPSEPSEFTVKILVSDDLGNNRTVYHKKHTPEDSPLSVPIEGAGVMDIEVWVDDILLYKTQE